MKMTASWTLLLCAMLLMSKSCSVYAFGGDDSAVADAWSETTTVSEGSGWEVTVLTTDKSVDTTVPEQQELETTTSTAEDNAETNTLSPGEQEAETSEAPTAGPIGEQSSTVGPDAKPSSASPNEEQSSVSPIPSEQPSSSTPDEEQSSTADSNDGQRTTTEAEPSETTLAPTEAPASAFECQTAGLFLCSEDCQRFHNCVLDPVTGELIDFEMVCPPLMAFSTTYGRCVHDHSSCDGFVCTSPGRFPDPNDDSYYYNCVWGVLGGYHKYVVRCSAGQRFEPLFGRCWRYDWSQAYPAEALEAIDLAAIKREQKEFKTEDKLRKKAEKNKEKLLRKQQKLEEKAAKKAAKEQAKKEAKEQAKANKPVSLESAESVEQPEN